MLFALYGVHCPQFKTPVGNLRNGCNKALGDKKASIALSERAVPDCLRVLTTRTTVSFLPPRPHRLCVAALNAECFTQLVAATRFLDVLGSLLSTLNVLSSIAVRSRLLDVPCCVAPCQAMHVSHLFLLHEVS